MKKLVLMKYLDVKGLPRYKRITENEVHGFRKRRNALYGRDERVALD